MGNSYVKQDNKWDIGKLTCKHIANVTSDLHFEYRMYDIFLENSSFRERNG